MADLKIVYDHSLFGGVDSKGIIKQLWGKDALANAVKIWLSLSQGELLRRPNDGGALVRLLAKPMSENAQQNIRTTITSALMNDFSPTLTDVQVDVTPDYAQRKWVIQASAYCDAIKDSIEFSISARNLV